LDTDYADGTEGHGVFRHEGHVGRTNALKSRPFYH
jgi:hypothetical protein